MLESQVRALKFLNKALEAEKDAKELLPDGEGIMEPMSNLVSYVNVRFSLFLCPLDKAV